MLKIKSGMTKKYSSLAYISNFRLSSIKFTICGIMSVSLRNNFAFYLNSQLKQKK